METNDPHTPLEPPDARLISYSLIRHVGFMLDELSAQGLRVRQNDAQQWCWVWADTTLQSARGFWAMGEAIVDAVVTRFPETFDTQGQEGQPTA